ncbi:MAG: response regulator [Proteobacteria bacterium]|nr:response regulator [Pseudomonadota bacterium]
MAAVLLIEDDPQYRKVVRAMLEGSGHVVRSVADGNHGIESFAERRPDLVITDIILPNRDGIETIVMLQEMDRTVPIIAMSGGSRSLLMFAQSAGAVATLAKPFDAAALLAAVAGATGAPAS